VLAGLGKMLENVARNVAAGALEAASKHGFQRAGQGYTIPMLVQEAGVLHNVISRVVEECLLEVDLSTVVSDAMKIGENLNALLGHSIQAFQQTKTYEAA